MRNEEFAAGQPSDDLSDHQKQILDFAGKTYNHPGKQEEDIRTQFGYSGTTFWRRMSDMLSNPKAMEYAPGTVNRYRRVVDQRLTHWGHQPRYSDPDTGGTQ